MSSWQTSRAIANDSISQVATAGVAVLDQDADASAHPARFGGRRLMGFFAAVLMLLGVATATAPSAQAATYYVTTGVCTDYRNIVPGAAFGGGVNFVFSDHGNTNVKLTARYSWGWARDARGNLPLYPSVVKNQYNVRFLDGAGRVLWTEYNSIPNGGSRWYYVGSNVRTIQVTANYYFWGWAMGPGVALN